jgi:hypothetical protein
MQVLNAKLRNFLLNCCKSTQICKKNGSYVPEKLDKRDHFIRLDVNNRFSVVLQLGDRLSNIV